MQQRPKREAFKTNVMLLVHLTGEQRNEESSTYCLYRSHYSLCPQPRLLRHGSRARRTVSGPGTMTSWRRRRCGRARKPQALRRRPRRVAITAALTRSGTSEHATAARDRFWATVCAAKREQRQALFFWLGRDAGTSGTCGWSWNTARRGTAAFPTMQAACAAVETVEGVYWPQLLLRGFQITPAVIEWQTHA